MCYPKEQDGYQGHNKAGEVLTLYCSYHRKVGFTSSSNLRQVHPYRMPATLKVTEMKETSKVLHELQ